MRNAYCKTLHELMVTNEKVYALTADIGFRNFDEIIKDFPERFINVGVAESNMIGIAAGLSLSGKIPFVFTIAPFVTMRCLEQIRVDLCYHNLPVKIIGAGGGFVYASQGTTHHAIEEVGIMRTLPNMTVICPADPAETSEAVLASMAIEGPAYIRIGRNNEPRVTNHNSNFKIGKANVMRQGDDITVISTGHILGNLVKAADELRKEGIGVRVVNMHTVKPIDKEIVLKCARETNAILTVEEHNIIGGLGSAVAEILAESLGNSINFQRLGLNDAYIDIHATYSELQKEYGLCSEGIARAIKTLLEQQTSIKSNKGTTSSFLQISDKYKMDGHKLLWHLDRVNEWVQNKRIAPLHIDFGITTGCNMACTYCYGIIQGRVGSKKRFDMPKEAILRFLKDAKDMDVRSIAFIGEGENTLNEALYDSLDYARKIDLDVSLATNGLHFKKERIKDMLSALTWIRFNISAGKPETFLKIHKVRGLDNVIDNIRACIEIKKKYSLNIVIGLQMVLMRENIGDVLPLAKIGRELGVDYLVIKPCSDDPEKSLNSPENEYKNMKKRLKEAEDFSNGDYKVVVKWTKMDNKGLKDFKVCFGTRFIIGISGDGSVFPCGHFFNIKREEFKMGNIIKRPFREIVNGERYWEVQKKIESVDVNNECESNCRQYYVSNFLWRLKNKPPHVNFI